MVCKALASKPEVPSPQGSAHSHSTVQWTLREASLPSEEQKRLSAQTEDAARARRRGDVLPLVLTPQQQTPRRRARQKDLYGTLVKWGVVWGGTRCDTKAAAQF